MTLLTNLLPIVVAVAIVMPTRDAHLQFEKWAREYGPIYSLILGTKILVVLSTDRAVKDLLDKRSNIYSHRQEMYIGQTLCSGDLRMLMLPYGGTWRMWRKLAHSLLNVTVAKSYEPYQMLENKQMLYEMVTQPERCMYNIRRYTNSLTTTMVFGWRSATYGDEKMAQLFDGFEEFAELNQTGIAALVDFFPWLRWLPDFLMPVCAKAKELHRKEKELYLGHWLKAKEQANAGTIMPCASEDLVAAQETEGFSDDEACYFTGTLLEAGSDTTSSTLYAFVQAMLLYPDVQKKAHEEIDRVAGPDRMPTMDDERQLQYIRAIVKETLRWMPCAILGAVPHAVTQDDWYDGYLIPKNAGVLNNVWAIHMDPARHPDPRRFNPDRYQNDFQSLADAAANPDVSKRDQFTFGAGRRICQGMHVAERSLFLGVARMLWAFDFTPAMDGQGRPIIPDQERLTQGFVCQPEEFPVAITPRSDARRKMVVNEWLAAEKECLDPVTKQWRVSPLGKARKRGMRKGVRARVGE
ncbi:cytochrome P450 [Chaetomium strumarium]|uniref:Cytochrome P450 n=1 Tax=Chaetomium strumarium TaxID=1170767 RepID=A0AAJ0M244_9PEZI|nr:cytochrome P450 [Chaetomium strumarium]